MPLHRKLLAEALGTLLLLATVVGSGIMGVALSDGNDGIALLANAAATAGILYVLIVVLGPISGAHFNPAVTLAMRLRGELSTAQRWPTSQCRSSLRSLAFCWRTRCSSSRCCNPARMYAPEAPNG